MSMGHWSILVIMITVVVSIFIGVFIPDLRRYRDYSKNSNMYLILFCPLFIISLWYVTSIVCFCLQYIVPAKAYMIPEYKFLRKAFQYVIFPKNVFLFTGKVSLSEYIKSNYLIIWRLSCPWGVLPLLVGWFSTSSKTGLDKELSRYDIDLSKKIKFDIYIKQYEKTPELLLGYNALLKSPAVLTDEDRFRHVHIVGTTGQGKTQLILNMMHKDISQGRGILFLDGKGDLETAKRVYHIAKEFRREKDFLFFSVNNLEHSNTYNPLSFGTATQLKDKIISSITFSEQHYKRECETLLQLFFNEYLTKAASRIPLNMKKLYEYIKQPPKEMTDYIEFYDNHKKNISTILNELVLLINTDFGQLFNGNEIDLMDAYYNNKIVCIALNSSETGSRVGKIITEDINTLCQQLHAKHREKRNTLCVYIDEYHAFGTPNFPITLSQARTAGFMITLSHQNYSQLLKINERHLSEIRGNTNTRIMFKTNDIDDINNFANEIGTYRDKTRTGDSVNIDGTQNEEAKGTDSVADFFILHPNRIKYLPKGHAGLKTPNEAGYLVIPYINHPAGTLPVVQHNFGTEQAPHVGSEPTQDKPGGETTVTEQKPKDKRIQSLEDI